MKKIKNLTKQDHQNAIYFATRKIIKTKLDKLIKTNEIFKGAVISDIDWPSHFYLPEKLKHEKNFKSAFPTKLSCEFFSCHPYFDDFKRCEKNMNVKRINVKNYSYLVCQEECFLANTEVAVFPERRWYEPSNLCIFGNSELKVWCLHPKSRSDEKKPGLTNVPPFKWIDERQICEITKEYCAYFSLDFNFEEKDCEKPDWFQSTAEVLIGTTFVRSLKKATPYLLADQPQKAVTHDIIRNKSTENREDSDMISVRTFLVDLGFDVADLLNDKILQRLKKISIDKLNKLSLAAFQRISVLPLKTVKNIIFMKFLLSHALNMVLFQIKIVLMSLNVALGVINFIGFVGMIVDTVDPVGYNHFINKNILHVIQNLLWDNQRETLKLFGNPPYIITPEYLMLIMMDINEHSDLFDNIDEFFLFDSYVTTYINHLTVNAAGQTIEFFDETEWKKMDDEFLNEHYVNLELNDYDKMISNIKSKYCKKNVASLLFSIIFIVMLLLKNITFLVIVFCIVFWLWIQLLF